MPKVVIDATRGLYQRSGLGLNLSSQAVSPADTATITPTEVLVLLTPASNSATNTIAAGSTGDVVIVSNVHASHSVTVSGGVIPAGQSAVFIYDGSQWSFVAN